MKTAQRKETGGRKAVFSIQGKEQNIKGIL